MKKKVLILGGSSLLSVNISFFLKKKYKLFLACNSKKPDIKFANSFFIKFNQEKLKLLISEIRPEIIIICLANTNIESCENNKISTKKLNFDQVKIITKLSKLYKSRLIFFSTDQVYRNSKNPSSENSTLKALNYYTKTKILAEQYIKKNLKNYLILRTNFFGYGPKYRKSFSDLILYYEKKKIVKYYFFDNFFSPIYLPYLVKALGKLIETNTFGTYNLCSPDFISKYQFAYHMVRKFNLNTKYIKKGYLNNNLNLVSRPLNMSISNKKLIRKIKLNIPKIKHQIVQMRRDFYKDYHLFMKSLKVIKK